MGWKNFFLPYALSLNFDFLLLYIILFFFLKNFLNCQITFFFWLF